MPEHATYGLDREVLTWFGIDITEGLTEGDGVVTFAIEGNAGWSQKPNGMGGVVQSFNRASRGTLKAKISREHSLHTTLKALCTVDKATRAIAGPLLWQRSSGELLIFDVARLMRDPDESGGTTASDVEWTWLFGSYAANAGDVIANII